MTAVVRHRREVPIGKPTDRPCPPPGRERILWRLRPVALALCLASLAVAPIPAGGAAADIDARLQVGDLEGAREILAGSEMSGGAPAYLALAGILGREEPPQVGEIAEALREAFRLDPSSPDPLVRLGVVLRDAGDLDDAEQALYAGLESFPDDPRLLRVLGTVRSRRGESSPGARLLQKAARLSPDDPEIGRDLGLALSATGLQGQALKLLLQARDRTPDDLDVRRALAEVYLSLDDAQHAGVEEQAAAEIAAIHDHARARRHALRSLSRRIAALEAAAATADPPPGTFRELVALYERRGDPEWSMPRLERLAAMHRKDPEAQAALGLAEASTGDPRRAARTLRAALGRDPASPLALEGYIRLYGGEFDAEELRTATEAAVEAAPDAADAHYFLGRARALGGDMEGAAAAFRQALLLRPGHQAAAVEVAAVQRARGDAAGAEALLEDAAAGETDSPEIFLALGLAALARGDDVAASQRLNRAQDLGARHPRLFRSLGDLATRRGDRITAAAYYRLSLAENPDQPGLRSLVETAG